MTPDTKKKICKLAGVSYTFIACDDYMGTEERVKREITLDILMRAVFAINREDRYTPEIIISSGKIRVEPMDSSKARNFFYCDYNNNETQALSSAVEYVIGEMDKTKGDKQ
jgi:hypothetical protein